MIHELAPGRRDRGWVIRVVFPDDCSLGSADRTMAAYGLHKMFAERRLNIITLNELRRLVQPNAAPAERIESQLRLVHCEKFDGVPSEVVSLLPELVGTFVGVQILPAAESGDVLTLRVPDRAVTEPTAAAD